MKISDKITELLNEDEKDLADINAAIMPLCLQFGLVMRMQRVNSKIAERYLACLTQVIMRGLVAEQIKSVDGGDLEFLEMAKTFGEKLIEIDAQQMAMVAKIGGESKQ